MSLPENLKKMRDYKGLTQEEVSKDLNMNRATYAHYETGRREPDVSTLKLLADYFNVTTDELLREYSSISKNLSLVTETGLANRIKELRTELDLTQEEFGKLFGIVKSTVSLYESGKSTPDDEIKKKIADYFNVSLDYLMGVSDIRNPYLHVILNNEYLNLAVELQRENITPQDIKCFIEIIKRNRKS